MLRLQIVKKTTASLFAIIMLTSCVSWIAPLVESELITLEAGQYKLDSTHAALLFKVEHLGLSTYVGRFNQFDASLNFDPTNMANATLQSVVEIDSIDINNAGLEKTLKEATWFDSKAFPQATFVSTSVTPITDNTFDFTGDLTLKGITKPVVFTATFNGGADNWISGKYTLGFTAVGKIKRADFDIDSFIPIVGNDIELEIYAEFVK